MQIAGGHIDDAGRVVGLLEPSLQPFLWEDGAGSPLGSALGRPLSINNQSQVIFESGVLWDAGIVTVLPFPPIAMNNRGQIVGPDLLWEDGVVTEIPVPEPVAINDLGHVLGMNASSVGIWDGVSFHCHDARSNFYYLLRPVALNNLDQFVCPGVCCGPTPDG